ncbi:protein inturned isoform X1 [Tachysurus ichikawai]
MAAAMWQITVACGAAGGVEGGVPAALLTTRLRHLHRYFHLQLPPRLLRVQWVRFPPRHGSETFYAVCVTGSRRFLTASTYISGRDRRDMIGSSQILSRLTAAIKPPSPGTIGRSRRDSLGSGRSGGSGGQFKFWLTLPFAFFLEFFSPTF